MMINFNRTTRNIFYGSLDVLLNISIMNYSSLHVPCITCMFLDNIKMYDRYLCNCSFRLYVVSVVEFLFEDIFMLFYSGCHICLFMCCDFFFKFLYDLFTCLYGTIIIPSTFWVITFLYPMKVWLCVQNVLKVVLGSFLKTHISF